MITSLEILDPQSTPIPWLGSVFKEPQQFDFSPMVNILWGGNGSGKSTLLKLLAMLFHCEQSGFPIVTENSIRELFRDDKPWPQNIKVEHDGQGVYFFDPSAAPGLVGGMAAFDEDFYELGVRNAVLKASTGQTNMVRFDRILRTALQEQVPKLEWKATRQPVGNFWGDRQAMVEQFLKATIAEGPPTILLDEPERSLDLPTQVRFWKFLQQHAIGTQFIVATHSPFALDLPLAKYIELQPGYLEKAREAVKGALLKPS